VTIKYIGFKPNPQGQTHRTPPAIFNKLNSIFQFTVDAAADASNALLPRYWTEEQDALKQDWSGERVFCNPPFGKAKDFLQKAGTACRCVMLLPLNCLTAKYYHAVGGADWIIIPEGRINYLTKDGQATKAMMLGTCFLIWGWLTDDEVEKLGGLTYQLY